ncbi:MAG TPA: hypothetical protein VF183_16305 [Acidimicrobiales bacterium]
MAATVAYTGTVVRAIVVDEDVVAEAAASALKDDAVSDVLVREMTEALGEQFFAGATDVLGTFGYDTTADIHAAAAAVLDDPRFAAAFADAVRSVHRAVLVDHRTVPVIDLTAALDAGRAVAIERNPAYAELLPTTASVLVTVPADRLPDLTGAANELEQRAVTAAVVATTALAAAFVLHPVRPRVARRVGAWAISVAIVQSGLALALPYGARQLPERVAPIASAIAETLRLRLVVPAVMMAAVGLALVIGARRWKRSLDAAHERLGASAFLAEDPDADPTPQQGEIELATLRSPMGAPPVPLTGTGQTSMVRSASEPLPTMHQGG